MNLNEEKSSTYDLNDNIKQRKRFLNIWLNERFEITDFGYQLTIFAMSEFIKNISQEVSEKYKSSGFVSGKDYTQIISKALRSAADDIDEIEKMRTL